MRKEPIRLKSADDIKRIRDSGKVISEIFNMISGIFLTGMSTWELDSLIDDLILKRKARSAFKTVRKYNYASCISIDNEAVHGIPSKKKYIPNGSLVKVDIGIVLNGYFSDACYTFMAGDVPDNARKLADTCRRALDRAINVMLPGSRMGDMGSTVQTYAESHGYSVVRTFSGHGVGYDLHELPVVPHYGRAGSGIILDEGLVIAVEPIINEGGPEVVCLDDGWTVVTADGKLSAQFEHSIAITKDGPFVLTK